MEGGQPIRLGLDNNLRKKDLFRALFCSVAVYLNNAAADIFFEKCRIDYPSITFDEVHMSLDLPKGQKYLLGYSGSSVFIAFRGTKSRSDVAHAIMVNGHTFSGGFVHKGFFKRAFLFSNSDRNPLPHLLQSGKRIIFCGHSLGGAVAHMVLFRFWLEREKLPSRDEYPDSMISLAFGAPHICDEKAARNINNNENLKWRFINFANQSDPVPHMLHRLSSTVSAVLRGSFFENDKALQSIGGFAEQSIDGYEVSGGLGVIRAARRESFGLASRIAVTATQQFLSSLSDVVDFFTPELNSSEVPKESDFHPIGQYISLIREAGDEGDRWSVDLYCGSDWRMRKFFDRELVFTMANLDHHRTRSYVAALAAVFPIDGSIRPMPNESPQVVVTTPAPKVTLAKWIIDGDSNQRHIIVEGENLLFLRDSVHVILDGEHPWKIKVQSDSALMIYEPSNRERSQERCSSDIPAAYVTIRTAFGQTSHVVQEDYPDNVTDVGVCRLISKIVQTLIVAATPTLNNPDHLPPARAVMDRMDNIMHCVPDMNGKKVSAKLAQITECCNDISGRRLENHCKDINYMVEAVVKYLRSSFKVEHYNSGNLQERAYSFLLNSKFLTGAAFVGMAFLPLDVGIGAALLVTSAAGILLLRPSETIIDSYNFVLISAIRETSEWSASHNPYDPTRTYSTSDLEIILYEQVKRSSPEFKGMVDDAHSSCIDNVRCLKSEVFKNATPESRLKLLKRIKLVYEIKSLYDKVAGIHYIGIFGAEGAGKSTFIEKVLQKHGPPDAQGPETDSDTHTHTHTHTHTRIVRSYKLNDSLWLVDFPGSDGSEHYADMWEQYTALSSSAILFLDFQYDIKRDQVKMFETVKKNLGVETEVAIVFNKVDLKFASRNSRKFTFEYFQIQRKENETKLGCNGKDIYFSCVDPDPPQKLTELKMMDVFGLEELVDRLVKPKSRITMNPSGI